MRKRAWKDAKQDFIIEQASTKLSLGRFGWKFFVTITLLGLGKYFFFVR